MLNDSKRIRLFEKLMVRYFQRLGVPVLIAPRLCSAL